MKKVIKDIQSFSNLEKSILIGIAGLFLPFQYASVVIGALLVYAFFKGNLIQCVKEQRGAIWLYAFVLLEIIVSLWYKNWIGVLNSFGFLGMALFIAYYRKILNPKLFQYILSEIILLSILAAGYGLYEFKIVSEKNGYSFFDFKILEKPKDRINSIFKNANFYATICEFVIVIALYKMSRAKKIGFRIYYIGIIILNFFMMLLTGCRTALLPFLIVFIVFFLLSKEKVYFWFSLSIETIVGILVLLFPNLVPRFSNFATLNSRFKIWKTSFQAIKMHPLLGEGPQTYGFVYKSLHGHKAPHAHNIYIDSILSYGVIGTIIGLGYFMSIILEIKEYYMNEKDRYLFPMILCFFIIALIHGIMDCTLNFVTTGIIFMMIVNSCSQYKKNI